MCPEVSAPSADVVSAFPEVSRILRDWRRVLRVVDGAR